jgi:hypothetical protein
MNGKKETVFHFREKRKPFSISVKKGISIFHFHLEGNKMDPFVEGNYFKISTKEWKQFKTFHFHAIPF